MHVNGSVGRSASVGFWRRGTCDEIRLALDIERSRTQERRRVHKLRIAGYVESVRNLGLEKTKKLEAGILGRYSEADDDGSTWDEVYRIPAGRKLMEEMDAYLASVAAAHRRDYGDVPYMFRGTRVEEALDVLKTRTSGHMGKYPFKAVSWDVGSAERYFVNAFIVYDSDSIRGVEGATMVEYTYRHVHLDIDEKIGTPMAIAHVPEREARVPVLAPGPKLEAVVVLEDRIGGNVLRLLEARTRAESVRLIRL